MNRLSGNNKFNLNYKKRPFDSYKSIVDKLDEETKNKLDRQRTMGMFAIVIGAALLILILAVTGIAVDKTRSVTGNVFVDKENVLIECFGDSITEGWTLNDEEVSYYSEPAYPEEMKTELLRLFDEDERKYNFKTLEVKNYGQTAACLYADSASRLSGNADIVLMLYIANNFIDRVDYEGVLESNIDLINNAGSKLFLLNYPYTDDCENKDKIEQANNLILNTAEKLSVTFIDVNSYFNGLMQEYSQQELYCSDGLHLTDLGYKLLGDFAARQVYDYYLENYK